MRPSQTYVHREDHSEVTEKREICLSNGSWEATISLENKHFRSIVVKAQGDQSPDVYKALFFSGSDIYKLQDLKVLLQSVSQEILDIVKERKEND